MGWISSFTDEKSKLKLDNNEPFVDLLEVEKYMRRM